MMTTNSKMRKQKVKENYFNWLYQQVEGRGNTSLEEFISDLDSIYFKCLVPNDDNRAIDGLQLRTRYLDYMDAESVEAEEYLSGPCTVLEMLIALAERMDFILYDYKKGPRAPAWFWLFINNLKLQKYYSEDKDAGRKKKLNKMIIKKFVDRDYQSSGVGGIFPLDDPERDQRDVEIWYQMMKYISENYDV